jgi:hypothetical protein
MAQEKIKNDISVSSRLKHITDTGKLKVIDFIIDYSFKDEQQIYTNGSILVPLFRVLDAIEQNGEPYQSSKQITMAQQTAFEILQSKITIDDTIEFREKHLPEILNAMEEYKKQTDDYKMKSTENVTNNHTLTAVEWLFDQMPLEWTIKGSAKKILEQAKQMEKEQIKNAIMHALDEDGHTGDWKVKFINDYIDKL